MSLEIKGLVMLLDENQNGDIGFSEFCAMMMAPQNPLNTLAKLRIKELRQAFEWYDIKGNGHFTAQELGDGMRKLQVSWADPEEPQRVLQRILDNVNDVGDAASIFAFSQIVLNPPAENALAVRMGFAWCGKKLEKSGAGMVRRPSGIAGVFTTESLGKATTPTIEENLSKKPFIGKKKVAVAEVAPEATFRRYGKPNATELAKYVELLKLAKGLGRSKQELQILRKILEQNLHSKIQEVCYYFDHLSPTCFQC